MQSYDTLEVHREPSGVARVVMARPAVFNAFDEKMIAEMTAAFEALGSDDAVRAIVLSGQGKAFSAGADLQWMKRASEAPYDWNLADGRRFAGMLYTLATCAKPTIARVHGVALGGGMGLACACDMALASDDARFAASEARFGILPSAIGPYLTNAVGKRHAKRLALMANRIDAHEAYRIGLVQQVVPVDELDAAIDAVLKEVMQNGPGAMAAIKVLFDQLEVGEITPEARELTAETISRVRGTDEAKEGFAAFLGKRPAAWIVPSPAESGRANG